MNPSVLLLGLASIAIRSISGTPLPSPSLDLKKTTHDLERLEKLLPVIRETEKLKKLVETLSQVRLSP